jgi:predicted permease
MPVLSAVVIVSLAVGIGVNTAIFSWIQAVVLNPIPGVRSGASFHYVEPVGERDSRPGVSWLEYRDVRERLRSFRDLMAFRMVAVNLGDPGRAERTYGQLVSGNFFAALGLTPARGRFFTESEVALTGAAPVAVISHDFWQTRLAGSTAVLGQTLRVNEREVTIIGVAPPDFQGTVLSLSFDLWLPATIAPVLFSGSRELEDRSVRGYSVMGLLQPNVSPRQAQTELDGVMQDLARTYPATNANIAGSVLAFTDAPRGPQRFLITALAILQGLMLLLLLAVCANTANLILARASTRVREVGVRRALGAGRGRVMSLILSESLLLALGGVVLGVLIAVWGSTALRAVPMISAFPVKFQTGVDVLSLMFAVLLGITCGVISGAPPALQLSRIDAQVALRAGVRSKGRSRTRDVLMGVEVALALVVLVMGGIFLQRFSQTRGTDPGFRMDGVTLAAYDLSSRNVNDTTAREFAATVLARLRALPTIESAAIASAVPLDIHGLPQRAFALEGRARTSLGEDRALSNIVTPDYFRTMGIALSAGTDFVDLRDASAAPQAVVNEEFVRSYLDGGEALGRRLQAGDRQYVIVGVVRNSVYDAFGERSKPIIYYSYRDRPRWSGELHVRARGGGEVTLVAELRRVMREIDASVPLYDVRSLNDHVERNLLFQRIPARIFVVLGPLLLILAAIGIYAVVDYSVARRTSEMGVRLALGATAGRIVSQVVRENLRVVGVGATIGWTAAYLVYIHAAPGSPINFLVFAGVPALLLAVAMTASLLPARRAGRVDPLVALRHE